MEMRSREITESSKRAVDSLQGVSSTLTTSATDAEKSIDEHTSKMTDAATQLRDNAMNADAITTQIASKMASTNQVLTHQMHGVAAQAKKAETSLSTLGEVAKIGQKELVDASEDATRRLKAWDQRVKSHAATLQSTSREVLKHAERASTTLQKRSGELRGVTEDVGLMLSELRERAELIGQDDFLRHATFVMERLQSLAVDMNRLLETEVSEDDWRRYNRGERSVFIRKILGFREKSKLAVIRDHYQEDQTFRDYVSRYISQFHSLIEEARKRDQENVMNTTLLSSDMGKVFMLLNRALGRDEDQS